MCNTVPRLCDPARHDHSVRPRTRGDERRERARNARPLRRSSFWATRRISNMLRDPRCQYRISSSYPSVKLLGNSIERAHTYDTGLGVRMQPTIREHKLFGDLHSAANEGSESTSCVTRHRLPDMGVPQSRIGEEPRIASSPRSLCDGWSHRRVTMAGYGTFRVARWRVCVHCAMDVEQHGKSRSAALPRYWDGPLASARVVTMSLRAKGGHILLCSSMGTV